MFRWLAICLLLCAGAVVLIPLSVGKNPKDVWLGYVQAGGQPPAPPPLTDKIPDAPVTITVESHLGAQAIVVPDGRIAPLEKQDVPAQRDGKLLFIGTEVPPEKVPQDPAERDRQGIIEYPMGYVAVGVQLGTVPAEQCFQIEGFVDPSTNQPLWFRRWHDGLPLPRGSDHVVVYKQRRYFKPLQVGDTVRKGDLLALVDPTLALADLSTKAAKVEAAEADRIASEKTREEFKTTYDLYSKTKGEGIAAEEVRRAKLQWDRYTEEEKAKRLTVAQDIEEMMAAHTTLRYHEIRADVTGVVRSIYKNPGESVKANADAVLQIQNTSRLRVEALLDLAEARRITKEMKVQVEASQVVSPRLVLPGHLGEVSAVAVGVGRLRKDGTPHTVVASGSSDRTVRLWDPQQGRLLWATEHRSPVRALACTTPTAAHALLASGCADGSAWLFDLDDLEKPPVLLAQRGEGPDATTLAHRGAVAAVAFNADGSRVATGGEDRSIAVWDTATGKLVERKTGAHQAAVTSLQYAPRRWWQGGRLVSAGGDQAVTVWRVDADKPLTKVLEHGHRGGDVAALGCDGDRVLFDQGKEIRLLGMEDRAVEGTLRNTGGASGFTTLALFSPDGHTILTNGAADNRLQLWRTPDRGGRGAEVRQLVWAQGSSTCGAFAPEGCLITARDHDGKEVSRSFLVTGTQDKQVLVWVMPSDEEVNERLAGKVSLVEQALDSGSRQVRVWAELSGWDDPATQQVRPWDRPPQWLVPGGSANMIIRP